MKIKKKGKIERTPEEKREYYERAFKRKAPKPTTVEDALKKRLPKFKQTDLIASICRSSFFEFVKEFWETVVPEKPIWNWHIEYLCDEIQIVMERVFKGTPKEYDLIINICPGSTKSLVASVMLSAWCWVRMPSIRFIGVSFAYALAMDLSRKARDVIKSDKYQECFPEVRIRDDQDSKAHFINTRGGMRVAVGVDGSITGLHGHVIAVDDPIDPKQASSEADLRTANQFLAETLPSRKVDKSVTPTILIMQRLSEGDPTAVRIERRKSSPVKLICLPAELTADVNPPELKSRYINGLMDPIRLHKGVLKEAEAELGEYGYAGQFLQNPRPRGGGMFKTDRFKIVPASYTPSRYKIMARGWDKASTLKAGAWTVGIKGLLDVDNNIWILDVIRDQWDSSLRERMIRQTAEDDGIRCVIGIEQEGGGGGKESAETTVRNLLGFSVRVWKVGESDGDKVKRADPFSSQVNGGTVYMVEAPWNKEYIKELSFFPFSKYKDQVDASSVLCWLLKKPKIVVGSFRHDDNVLTQTY